MSHINREYLASRVVDRSERNPREDGLMPSELEENDNFTQNHKILKGKNTLEGKKCWFFDKLFLNGRQEKVYFLQQNTMDQWKKLTQKILLQFIFTSSESESFQNKIDTVLKPFL